MNKKVLIMTGIGLILLVAVIAASLNAVFTVTDIEVNYVPVSDQGAEESYALQQRLEEEFVGKSTTFLDLSDIKEVVKEFPIFRLDAEPEKKFPRTVTLTISERKEAYCFRRADNGLYAILDEEGRYLYDSETNLNRRKGENILFEGFSFDRTEPGEIVTGSDPEAMATLRAAMTLASVFTDELGEARANIASISLVETPNPAMGDYFLRMQMKEGVRIEIYEITREMSAKSEEALKKYLALTDAQKLYGFFDIVDNVADGGFTVSSHRELKPAGA